MEYTLLVDEITDLLENCQRVDTIGQALNSVSDSIPILCIKNVLLNNLLIHRNNGSIGCIANIMNNFRTSYGRPLGHLNTISGKIIVPKWWPNNHYIYSKFGIPFRKNKQLLVDAYILNSDLNFKVLELIREIPAFKDERTWSF